MSKIIGNKLPIRIVGDKILRTKAEPVEKITEEIKQFIYDLTETMYIRDGVGLAAPQVGKSLRIFVIDPQWSETEKRKPMVFINPKFKEFRGEETREEGCLSLPGIFAEVKRADEVVIEAYDINMKKFTYKASGITAVALQHEYDHLEGKLFIDSVSKLKLFSVMRKIKMLEKQTNGNGENIRD